MPDPKRPSGRAADELRAVSLEADVNKYAEGSCLAKFGDTHVLVTATVDTRVPAWMRGQGRGWVTAEYGMLPRATETRTDREASRGRQGGRTLEIQRLVGRALRAVTDLKILGEVQLKVDCDVLQADGGTRTAAITGGYVALAMATRHLRRIGALKADPLREAVAAVSCGVVRGTPVLDLDYSEDSAADTDANFVLTASGGLVEVQGSAEGAPFSEAELMAMLGLARSGVARLLDLQGEALARLG